MTFLVNLCICRENGDLLYVARRNDTDEAAIKAAQRRGIQLPERVLVIRHEVRTRYRINPDGSSTLLVDEPADGEPPAADRDS